MQAGELWAWDPEGRCGGWGSEVALNNGLF